MASERAPMFHPRHADEWADSLTRGVGHLREHLGSVRGPTRGVSPAEARAKVEAVDLDRPLGDLEEALDELSTIWLDDAVWFHEPRYAAHLNCPVALSALVGEMLLSTVNASLDTFDQSGGATFIERSLIAWTAGRIGYDGAEPDGIFTSGGSQSNLQALLLARGRAQEAGVPMSRMRILASQEAHFSVQKSARLLGLGEHAVVPVATDRRRRLDPVALERALEDLTGVPIAVVATAGTTDFGAIDPLSAVADLCASCDAWMHVDAAYGGGLLVSPTRGHLLAGIERADSVTVDFHKTWFQPVSSSAVIVKQGSDLRHCTWHADYLNPRGSTQPNQVDKSLQTTRRFDALKLWLTLRVDGATAIGEAFDSVIDLAAEVHRTMRQLPDVEVAAAGDLSTIVFRYRPRGARGLCGLQRDVRRTLYESGEAMVAATTVDGEAFLKLTLLNPMATREDVLGIVDAVRAAGARLLAEDLEVAS